MGKDILLAWSPTVPRHSPRTVQVVEKAECPLRYHRKNLTQAENSSYLGYYGTSQVWSWGPNCHVWWERCWMWSWDRALTAAKGRGWRFAWSFPFVTV